MNADRSLIAVCDDEVAIADLVGQLVEASGYDALVCYSPIALLDAMAKGGIDLVLLDVMMPGMDGFACCREIRRTSDVPIVFLTAKDDEIDKVVGFELGADDYVVKPFKPRELMARVKARLRRSEHPHETEAANIIERGGITLDVDSFQADLHGEPLSLTPKEFSLLACLMRQGGAAVPSKTLYETAWGESANEQSNNTIMVHVRHVRKKLAAIDSSREFIETVWGVGYRFS